MSGAAAAPPMAEQRVFVEPRRNPGSSSQTSQTGQTAQATGPGAGAHWRNGARHNCIRTGAEAALL